MYKMILPVFFCLHLGMGYWVTELLGYLVNTQQLHDLITMAIFCLPKPPDCKSSVLTYYLLSMSDSYYFRYVWWKYCRKSTGITANALNIDAINILPPDLLSGGNGIDDTLLICADLSGRKNEETRLKKEKRLVFLVIEENAAPDLIDYWYYPLKK